MTVKTDFIASNESMKGEDTKSNRFKELRSAFAKNGNEFCENTSLHGLKYLTDKELYPRERFFFGIAFAIVAFLAGYFMLNVWDKWNTTPVIFGINPKASYITEEPFPAVTICNLNVAYKSKAEQYSIFSTEYAMLQMLCKRVVNVTIADSITDWSTLVNFMTEIAQPCSNMLVNCQFGAVKYNCSELFKPVITDEGLCCAFNTIHPAFIFQSYNYSKSLQNQTMGDHVPVAWSAESGYQPNLPAKYYPRRAVGVGETLGLSLTIDVESDEYYCSSLNSLGFKMAVHNPNESPSLREGGLLLAPGTETKVLVRHERYETDQKLRSIHHKQRQCLFEDEENLKVYNQYTQRNCEIECLAKLLLKYCGCITYYLSVLYSNEPICSIYQVTCVERMRIASMLTEYNTTGCDERCLPSCFDINYIPNYFSAPLKHYGFQIANQVVKNMSNSYVEDNIVVMHMFHREYAYRSYKQTEFFGGTDALSAIGGLIGLFLGFSFIFFAEILFFVFIKPLRQERRQNFAAGNSLNVKDSSSKAHPSWKRPIRKRHTYILGCNDTTVGGFYGYRNPYSEKKHFSKEFFKRKW